MAASVPESHRESRHRQWNYAGKLNVARKAKTEFGDFQTPDALARRVCGVLRRLGVSPGSVVEPTCGTGSFLRASVDVFPECGRFLGFEINPHHVQTAKSVTRAEVGCENFFEKDWPAALSGLQSPVLVVGNPPWVTNSDVGVWNGDNLPIKSNAQGMNGLDALTGKSNFDISEWMISHLLECLTGKDAVLAMLCKTTVARKVLHHAWRRNLQISASSVYLIDAGEHFGVSVDACLLVCILEPGSASRECAVYLGLEAPAPESTFAYRDGKLVADLGAYDTYGYLSGPSPLRWRSGVKHDCSRVMELLPRGSDTFENGLGEVVSLEPTYLYPMLKSSELMKQIPTPTRFMLVPQRSIGEDTSKVERETPRTWAYLQSHAARLDGRSSSIYRNRPRFSIFGVGPYSFAPWKVAISGFYKRLDFRCVGPAGGKPIVLDDTCYFLPCRTRRDADLLTGLLNSEAARGFFGSLVFWDAKRPITARLLANLDLELLAEETGVTLPRWSDSSVLQATLPFEKHLIGAAHSTMGVKD